MIKKALVIPYFGEWPKWFDLYLYSLGKNPSLEVIFFTDIPTDGLRFVPDNAKFIRISFEEYCRQAGEKLGVEFHPSRFYKLCDLKPFYPIIHREELRAFDYVGWGDIDLIYGDIETFFPDSEIIKYDIISTHSYIISGHFTLIKNSPTVYEKFMNIPYWRWFVADSNNHVVDELWLSYFLTPKLKYARYFYDKLGGYCGVHKGWAEAIMQSLARLIYPRYHLKELYTTPIPERGKFITYKNGRVFDSSGRELPYIHFQYFKSPNYKTSIVNCWAGDFYRVDDSFFNGYGTIIIDKEGIKSEPDVCRNN